MRKKKHLKMFAVMFALIMALCMSTVIANATTKKVTISAKSQTVYVGTKNKSLGVKVTKGAKVTYKSSASSVISVASSGKITAKKAGTAKITIKATKKGYTSATKVITVKAVRASQTITASNVSIPLSTTKNLKAKAKTTLSYKSSNTAVATVDSKGNVKAKKAGTTTITITAKATTRYKSAKKSIKVTVYKRANNSITSVDSLSIPTGTTKSLSATGKTTLSYASSNTAVATVDSKGNVKGIKAGTATITIKAKATTKYNSLTKKVTVEVYDRADNSITCPDSLSIPRGTYKDLNATGKTTLSYSSSDTSVATVDSTGRVEGVKNGTATITVTAEDTTEYNRLTKNVPVTVYTLQKNEITVSADGADSNGVYHVTKGDTFNLSAKGKTVLGYASEDTSIATVDSNGNVTGIAPGSTTIIISARETNEYRYLAKEVPVIVTEPESPTATPTPVQTEPSKPVEPESPTPTPLPTEIGGPTVPEVPQEVYEVSRIAYDDCDGSGHGYYEITYSDGTVVYEEY